MTIKARELYVGDYLNYEGAAYMVREWDGYTATLEKLAGNEIREVHLTGTVTVF